MPPEPDKRGRLHLKATHDSSRVHEWSIRINQAWHSWYRTVDSEGYTWDVLLRETHAVMAAQQFFRTVLGAKPMVTPRLITVDQHAAYPPAVQDLKQAEDLPQRGELRQNPSSLRATMIRLVGYGPRLRAAPWQPPPRVGEQCNRGHQRPMISGLIGGRTWTLDCS